jgi:hypothetical protein
MKTAHDFLTDEGAYFHEHVPESWEEEGNTDNGPRLVGGPAFDVYSGDSHQIIIQGGVIVEMMPTKFFEYDF